MQPPKCKMYFHSMNWTIKLLLLLWSLCRFMSQCLFLPGEAGSKAVPCRLKSLSSTSSDVAHSLPADIPSHDNVPRTPRTPGRNDPKRGPRFYPVVKETAKQDPQVSLTLEPSGATLNLIHPLISWCLSHPCQPQSKHWQVNNRTVLHVTALTNPQ